MDYSAIRAVDISRWPEIQLASHQFYTQDSTEESFLQILKMQGVNTIRLRVWIRPDNDYCGFEDVKTFAAQLKSMGFRIWLNPHYSNTWADPGHQNPPPQWQQCTYDEIQDSVAAYTALLVTEIQPDYIQLGNEINPGFLHPFGHINNQLQFVQLLNTASHAVRTNAPDCQIMLHYAGHEHASWWFEKVDSVDFDIAALSYYPWWHGKSLDDLEDNIEALHIQTGKSIVVAETAYPFTLGWNDWTNNIVGGLDKLIDQFPPTYYGQRDFLTEISSISTQTPGGIGFAYWGAELISWKSDTSKSASVWENQALFNFNNVAVPALDAFQP